MDESNCITNLSIIMDINSKNMHKHNNYFFISGLQGRIGCYEDFQQGWKFTDIQIELILIPVNLPTARQMGVIIESS